MNSPRLSHQKYPYLVKQLKDYRDGLRTNDNGVMAPTAKNLSDEADRGVGPLPGKPLVSCSADSWDNSRTLEVSPMIYLTAIQRQSQNPRNRRQARRESSTVARAGGTWSRGPACGDATAKTRNAADSTDLSYCRNPLRGCAHKHAGNRGDASPLRGRIQAQYAWNLLRPPRAQR